VRRRRPHHHDRSVQTGFWTFCLICPIDAPVQMRDDMVQEKKEKNSQPETDKSRQKCPSSFSRRLFNGRDYQAPDRCSCHHTPRKPGQCPLHTGFKVFFQEKYTCSSACRANKRDQQSPDNSFHFRTNKPF